MNYPTSAAGTGQEAAANPLGNPAVIDKPRLHRQIETLNRTLAVCHQSARNIERVADRILGQKPEHAGKDTPKPTLDTDTIERRLDDTQEFIDMLSVRLIHVVQRLNSAV